MANKDDRLKKDEIRTKFIIDAKYGETGGFPSGVGATAVLCKVERLRRIGEHVYSNEYECIIRNTRENHAEVLLLEEIKELMKDENEEEEENVSVTLIQNYSPCDLNRHKSNRNAITGCATDLIQFKDDMEKQGKSVRIEITFANFYRWIGDFGDGPRHMKGLKKMLKSGVKLTLLQGEEMWKTFLNDTCYVNLTSEEKTELLKKVTSDKRKKREKEDQRLFQEHVDLRQDSSSDTDVTQLEEKLNTQLNFWYRVFIVKVVTIASQIW